MLNENEKARKIIKQEALKKVTYDYDVIYLTVKDQLIDNSTTFRDALLQYIDVEDLMLIESELPTLTIFVPELPLDAFSAYSWDTSSEIPTVFFISSKTNLCLPYYYVSENKLEKETFKEDLIPACPVVLVKLNERLVKSSITKSSPETSLLRSASSSSVQIEFIDNLFNNNNSNSEANELQLKASHRDPNRGGNSRPAQAIKPALRPEQYAKVVTAFDKFGLDGWQRDHVYYSLTKTQTKGAIDNSQKEHIVGFELVGDPKNALNKISDQADDPKFNWDVHESTSTNNYKPLWTDGEFEFKVYVYLGGATAVGNVLTTYFRMQPGDLFQSVYNNSRTESLPGIPNAVPQGRSLQLQRTYFTNPIPLFKWDLENYGAIVKINIQEFDVSETITRTSTTTTEMTQNFKFDAGFDKVVKIGLGYGYNEKKTVTNTYTVVSNVGNDDLGEVIINFYDPILLDKNSVNITYAPEPNYNTEYKTGWFRVFIAPLDIYK